MSAFGNQNYGTPLGAINPPEFFDPQGSGFYDYSGFSSRSGVLGFSGNVGWSGFSAFCGPDGLEFIPYRPTLTFPINFAILSGVVKVTWKEAIPQDPCGDKVFYELQFTRTLSLDSGWKTLSSDLPIGTISYDWDVTDIPYTEDGGLRIRARDNKFLYSNYSKSNQPFIVANHAPNPASIISPTANDTFDYCMPVVWKEPKVKDIDGQGVSYMLEVTDKYSANTGWLTVPGAESLPEGTSSFNVSTFDFPEGNDYGIRLSAVDSLGLASAPIAVGPIRIQHQGTFIIDTIPPEGSLAINDGAALSASAKIKLTLFAFDETTGVKDVRFRNDGEDCWSDFDSFTNEKFWDLPKSDGVKKVFVQYRDYAGNVSEVCDCEIVSRVLCDEGNVTDIEVFNNKLYAAFDAKGNLVEYKVLVKRAAALPEAEVTALARFKNYLYVATYDPVGGSAAVYTYDGRATRVYSIAGAKILSMLAYNGSLFIGMDNGRILSFDGMNATTVYSALSAITRLRTDGAILFATVLGGGEYLSTADGTTWKVNTF